jgi:hypothetical protein
VKLNVDVPVQCMCRGHIRYTKCDVWHTSIGQLKVKNGQVFLGISVERQWRLAMFISVAYFCLFQIQSKHADLHKTYVEMQQKLEEVKYLFSPSRCCTSSGTKLSVWDISRPTLGWDVSRPTLGCQPILRRSWFMKLTRYWTDSVRNKEIWKWTFITGT